MKLRRLLLVILGLPKTILINFYYLPFKTALKLPILVSHRVWVMDMSGTLDIQQPHFGTVQIGFGEVGIFDQHRSRSVLQIKGKLIFKGKARIGHGSKISVNGGTLTFCDGVNITAQSSIVCKKEIYIGANCLISWDVLIMDTDSHAIFPKKGGALINPDKKVHIGDNVWIGCRCLILKGVTINNGNIIAAGSLVSKSIVDIESIIAGSPATVKYTDVVWHE
jgi:acetyltransferase-like isoleucine patch superfamily enzyme